MEQSEEIVLENDLFHYINHIRILQEDFEAWLK